MAAMRSASTSNQAKKKSGSGCFLGLWLVVIAIGCVGWWLVPRLHRIDIETARDGDLIAVAKSLIAEELPQKPSKETAAPDLAPVELPAGIPNSEPATVAATESTAKPDGGVATIPVAPPPPPPVPTEAIAVGPSLPADWEAKELRGIYLSRYQVTNRASEQTIRDRVRYYKAQGINTLIHGVWGNGCAMYPSEVMQATLGYASCPNLFEDQWLDWLLDEAHQQGMQVHAYFEKGIKLDKNSPIFDLATTRGWFVPGVDKTYPSVDHYLLNVENPEVAKYFTEIAAEFVRQYPTIDAVQWDDYVGYHEDLPGNADRTPQLTAFMLNIRQAVKQENPDVSFDVCHHNPYWGKRYFDADWANWQVDRAFIQVYNDDNFDVEMDYVQQNAGIAISDNQFNRLERLAANPKVKSVLLFPSAGRPEETAAKFRAVWEAAK